MSRKNVPWTKWRFSLGGIWLALAASTMAWTLLKPRRSIVDVERLDAADMAVALLFAVIGCFFLFLEWRNRKPVVVKIGRSEEGDTEESSSASEGSETSHFDDDRSPA